MLVIFSDFRALLRTASVGVMLLLVGCSSNTINVYDGDTLPNDQVAILHATGDIDIVAIDGKPMKKYLLSDLDIDYHLLPGPHTVILRYSGVWAAPKQRNADSASSAELIESGLLRVDFTATRGEVYEFDYVKPKNRRHAQALSENFMVHLNAASGGRVVSAKPYRVSAGQKVAPATADPMRSLVSGVTSVVTGTRAQTPSYPEPAKSADQEAVATPAATAVVLPVVTPDSPADPAARLPRLDALKLMWKRASKEEKKQFLRWAFE
ncbi:MAG: hypothetical protein CSB48_06805 [Proteobacteria bacterium]|nr:MAG: hypothetical protein CSB48_06805 [Pseudomonadota bacterium]